MTGKIREIAFDTETTGLDPSQAVQEEADAEPDDEVDVSAGTGSVSNPAIEKKKETVDRTDDPVRMYLRKMGSVSLLTREGEVEIAKRIEEGEALVARVIVKTPIAFKEVITLGDRLGKGGGHAHLQVFDVVSVFCVHLLLPW